MPGNPAIDELDATNHNSLQHKVVLITGASRGLGREIAIAFSREGVRLAVASRNREQLDALAATIRNMGGDIHAIATDVTDPQQIRHCIDHVLSAYGQVDILVSNAGSNTYGRILELGLDDWDRIINTNLRPAFLLAQHALPTMLERGQGHIFLIASIVGRRPKVGAAAYGAAKAGLINFGQSLNLEFAQQGIRTTVVIPGAIDTPWFDDRADIDRSQIIDPGQLAWLIVQAAKLFPGSHLPEIVVQPQKEVPPRPGFG